jgi:tetratricopeptide (TPR) repeat protein
MIGALLAIVAGIAETITGSMGIFDRLIVLMESPLATPAPFAGEAPNEVLIVVAQFDRADGIPDARAHEKIADEIRRVVNSLGINNVRVEILPEVIPKGDRNVAGAKAEEYGATTIIWGEETSVDVRVDLLNTRSVWQSVSIRSGENGLEMQSSLQYQTQSDVDNFSFQDAEMATQSGFPIEPWIPLVDSPLLVPPQSVAVIETDGTYVTTYNDPQKYIQLITLDLPTEITFFALMPIALIQQFSGNEETALNLLERALASKSSTKAVDDIGKIYQEAGRLHLSIARQIEIAEQDHSNADVEGHAEAAKKWLHKAVEAGIADGITYYFLGFAYSHTREYTTAIYYYDRAMDKLPDDHTKVFILHDRSIAKIEIGNDRAALLDINQLLQIDPEATAAYVNRSNIKSRMNDHLSVISDINKVWQLAPGATNDPGLLNLFGEAQMAVGDYVGAVGTYERLLNVVEPSQRSLARQRLDKALELQNQ